MNAELHTTHGAAAMPWTEDRVELLKTLWTEGLSASQIATRLAQGVTRNAVIGKAHRLNLAGRAQAPRSAAPREPRQQHQPSHPGRVTGQPSMPLAGNTALKPQPRAAHQPRAVAKPAPAPMRLVDVAKSSRLTIQHLSNKTCKWPIGDPGHADFCFCGHGPRDGSPYCEYHARMAYQPLQDRRNRKTSYG